ncbi:phage/plasmid replication domain-containing protein [Pseudomonas amygdali]|uniref:phage/plasmid replication domain-containing protein n=1 Tax=Pseudomonas amygdali TaxID=47877 RepID=UPI0009E2D1AA|nr:phage/plasmid replication protein [Pseudomonas amygdali]
MNMSLVSRLLQEKAVVTHPNSVRTTAIYFQLWKEGKSFDLTKRQVQVHRSRLRRIGIDIAFPYTESFDRVFTQEFGHKAD